MRAKFLPAIFLAFIVLFFVDEAESKTLTDHTVVVSYNNEYKDLQGGTILGTNQYYYRRYTIYNIGFNFKYDDRWYNRVELTENSIVAFEPMCGRSYPYPYIYKRYYSNSYGMTYNRPALYVFQQYIMYPQQYTATAVTKYKIDGTAPNRILKIEWKNRAPYASDYPPSSKVSFQCWLYETSNVIEYRYGDIELSSGYDWNYYTYSNYYYRYAHFQVGYTACDYMPSPGVGYSYEYINVYGKDNGVKHVPHYSTVNPLPRKDFSSIQNADEFDAFQRGTIITLTPYPMIVGSRPVTDQIYAHGQIYTGSRHPAAIFNRTDVNDEEVYARLKISGPLPKSSPDYQTIYTAVMSPTELDTEYSYFDPQPFGEGVVCPIPHAKGIAARLSDGALDLQTNADEIPGGTYLVEAEMVLLEDNGDILFTSKAPQETFIIALDDDLAIYALNSPKDKERKKYPFSTGIVPIQARFVNIGLSTIYQFSAVATVYKNGVRVFTDSLTWVGDPNPLYTGDAVTLDFSHFNPDEVGDFTIKIEANLDYILDEDGDPIETIDDEPANNVFPKSFEGDYVFHVAYEFEPGAAAIIQPQGELFLKVPVFPVGKFINNGVSDMSDVPVRMKIFDPYGATVYDDNILIDDIQSGRYNYKYQIFNEIFIPTTPGTYRACIYVNYNGDPYEENNEFCQEFTVTTGMSGTYTISANGSGPRNFTSFQEALDMMYERTVTGPIEFILPDSYYEVGSLESGGLPALDFRTKIIGVDEDNPIVFKPSQQKSVMPNSIHINLVSDVGIGMIFGQTLNMPNPKAPINKVKRSLFNEYSQSEGFIKFDGGAQKSIKITLDANGSDFRAPIYLAEGAKNITIRNVSIGNTNNNDKSYHNVIPLSVFDQSQFKFKYQPNQQDDDETFSTGVLVRAMPPIDPETNSNIYQLDTIPNHSNIIENCNISGFGYGIVSLGMGPLLNQGNGRYFRVYNYDNLYKNNQITDIGKAGIFVGFEEYTEVVGNRIWNVHGQNGTDVAGVIAGGQSKDGWFGYNNIGLEISANEISNLRSQQSITGIRVEQHLVELTDNSADIVQFPDIAEENYIKNNSIWGLYPLNDDVARIGVHLYTNRENDTWDLTQRQPAASNYNTREDYVVNNTIIIDNDNNVSNDGPLAGIAIEQGKDTYVYNNAIAVLDNDVSDDCQLSSALYFYGMKPNHLGGIDIDRNAYWIGDADASYFRFIETDDENDIIEFGSTFEYNEIDQWRYWTGLDMNSVIGDFTKELDYFGTTPKRLRIITDPLPPKGSALNNRGKSIDGVKRDIDGNLRGVAAQRYDIGAFEFDGRMYTRDAEVLRIEAPGNYRNGVGVFSDAQYVMTTAPVDVVARIRNNGSTSLEDVSVVCKIYRENSNGTFTTNPEIEQEIKIDLASTETDMFSFNLADKAGLDFKPQTYGDLRGAVPAYNVPKMFKAMEANVTPLYRIVVESESDEVIPNNLIQKEVRFYIQKSNIKMLISAEQANADLDINNPRPDNPSIDQIAGRLNLDSILIGLKRMGWYNDLTLEDPRIDVDIFDRSNWEDRGVDYSMYRSVLWADGDDKPLTRYQVIDLENYLNVSFEEEKRNLIVCSQEIIRENTDIATLADEDRKPPTNELFVQNHLRATYRAPGNPLGPGVSNDENSIIGVSYSRGMGCDILNTGYDNGVTADEDPYCGLINVHNALLLEGVARLGFYYFEPNLDPDEDPISPNDKIMGVSTSSLTTNVLLNSVDWRHFSDIEFMLRVMFDYCIANGGKIVPVELLSFDANQVGQSVELVWSTASEENSSRFEVERATESLSGRTAFTKVDEVAAAGNSGIISNYGPIFDNNIEYGNTYIYRLKMVDRDGEFEYSDERVVEIKGVNGLLTLSQPMPNPATDEVSFELNLSNEMDINVALYDISGKVAINVFSGRKSAGNTTLDIDLSQISSGSYTLVVKSGDMIISRPVNVQK